MIANEPIPFENEANQEKRPFAPGPNFSTYLKARGIEYEIHFIKRKHSTTNFCFRRKYTLVMTPIFPGSNFLSRPSAGYPLKNADILQICHITASNHTKSEFIWKPCDTIQKQSPNYTWVHVRESKHMSLFQTHKQRINSHRVFSNQIGW